MEGQTGFQPERSTAFNDDGFKPERSTAFDNDGFGPTSPEPKEGSDYNSSGFQAEPKPATKFNSEGFTPVSGGFKDEPSPSTERDQPQFNSTGFAPVSSGFQDTPIQQTGFQPQDGQEEGGYNQRGFQPNSSGWESQPGFEPSSSGFSQGGFQSDERRMPDSPRLPPVSHQGVSSDDGNDGFKPERSSGFGDEERSSGGFSQTGFRDEYS